MNSLGFPGKTEHCTVFAGSRSSEDRFFFGLVLGMSNIRVFVAGSGRERAPVRGKPTKPKNTVIPREYKANT
jgi:hypothetical protein